MLGCTPRTRATSIIRLPFLPLQLAQNLFFLWQEQAYASKRSPDDQGAWYARASTCVMHGCDSAVHHSRVVVVWHSCASCEAYMCRLPRTKLASQPRPQSPFNLPPQHCRSDAPSSPVPVHPMGDHGVNILKESSACLQPACPCNNAQRLCSLRQTFSTSPQKARTSDC